MIAVKRLPPQIVPPRSYSILKGSRSKPPSACGQKWMFLAPTIRHRMAPASATTFTCPIFGLFLWWRLLLWSRCSCERSRREVCRYQLWSEVVPTPATTCCALLSALQDEVFYAALVVLGRGRQRRLRRGLTISWKGQTTETASRAYYNVASALRHKPKRAESDRY